MATYVVATVKILDPDVMEPYGAIAAPLVEKFGGEYITNMEIAPEPVEGNWPTDRATVIMRWPSKEAFYDFWNSPEYAVAKEIRKDKIILENVVLEGAD